MNQQCQKTKILCQLQGKISITKKKRLQQQKQDNNEAIANQTTVEVTVVPQQVNKAIIL